MELVIEFFDFLIQGLFWLFVISVIRALIFSRVDKIVEQETETLKEKLTSMIHRIKQEKYGDTYYWFDYDNDQFLAQGRTDSEIVDALKKRFPTHIFIVNGDRALRGPEWKLVPIQELTKKSV